MKFFEKGEFKLLWPFYSEAIIVQIFYLYSLFFIPYAFSIGLNLTQVGIIFSALALSSLIFEIPTGAIADIFGRKFSVVLGYVLMGTIFTALFFTTNFYWIIVLFFLLGISNTLQSGASDAWIVDLVKIHKKGHLVQDYYNKQTILLNGGAIISGIIGALLVKQFGLQIIWLATGFSYFIGVGLLLFGKEYFVRKKQSVKEHTKELINHTKNSLNYSRKHKVISMLLLITIITSISFMFSSYTNWFAMFSQLGFKDHWFGYLESVVAFFGMLVPLLNKKLVKKFGERKSFVISLSLICLTLLSIFIFKNLVMLVIFFIIYSSLLWFYGPLRSAYFQRFIPNKMRATIGSLNQMIRSLIYIIILPLIGFMADKIGPKNVLPIGGISLIIAIILYYRIEDKPKSL